MRKYRKYALFAVVFSVSVRLDYTAVWGTNLLYDCICSTLDRCPSHQEPLSLSLSMHGKNTYLTQMFQWYIKESMMYGAHKKSNTLTCHFLKSREKVNSLTELFSLRFVLHYAFEWIGSRTVIEDVWGTYGSERNWIAWTLKQHLKCNLESIKKPSAHQIATGQQWNADAGTQPRSI